MNKTLNLLIKQQNRKSAGKHLDVLDQKMNVKNKMDPRVIRTKKLIQEALLMLMHKKDFKDITVKDISEEATVNRATFYAHYLDKEDLLDTMVSDAIDLCLGNRILPGQKFNAKTGRELILILYDYQVAFFERFSMDTQSIAGRLENLVKAKIENLVADLIQNQNELPLEKNADQQILVTMISGALYNASLTYFRKTKNKP